MKTLDLNAYGVMEMNHQEMVGTDGGLSFGDVFGAAVGVVVSAAAGIVVASSLVAGAIGAGVGLAAMETHNNGTLMNMNQANPKLI